MKTQLILRKNLLGSLFFLIAFLFAFVSKGQSNNFYYYRGEKIGLELDKENKQKKWLPINVSLSAYKGSIVQLRFVGTSGNGYQGDAAIDGIQIVTAKKIKGKNYFQSELNSSLMDSPQIMIFPNPAQDYAVLEIESLEAEEVTVSVVDNLGKEIFTHRAHLGESKTEFRLPTSTFAPGSYMIIVTSNSGQIFNEKLIVSK